MSFSIKLKSEDAVRRGGSSPLLISNLEEVSDYFLSSSS